MINLIGKIISDRKKDPITLKSGEIYQVRVLALNDGTSDFNTIVGVPVDYKVVLDKEGNAVISNVRTARTWNEEQKRFVSVPVNFYIPRVSKS